MGNALDRARAAQAETEALKVSAQETTRRCRRRPPS